MRIKIYRLFICIMGLLFLVTGEVAAKGKKKQEVKADAPAPQKRSVKYDRLFRGKKVETKKGLLTIHKIGAKLYFELPMNLLNREFLLGTTVSEISNNGNVLVGQKASEPLHVKFNIIDSTLYMQEVTNGTRPNVYADEVGMQQAVAKSTIIPLMQAFKIAAYNRDTTTVVFDVTEMFLGDNKRMDPFDPYGKTAAFGLLTRKATLNKSLSYLDSFKAFEDNISICSVLTYHEVLTRKNTGYRHAEQVTMKVNRSMILLPEKEDMMRWRLADPRVGYFVSSRVHMGMDVDRSTRTYFMHRWNLEPSDMEKFKRGELVEPVKPIVFYVDNTFPASWKNAIHEGIRTWNKAFERIGFKNAVQSKDFPRDDAEFDPDNLKYSCVRYAPIGVENAMGPSWVDPRTGEIMNASVFVYHDIVKLVNEMRFVQTAQLDERVRTPKLSDEVMHESLRYIIAHEVGHCLGLMHNMAASAAFPADSLRSAAFTRKYGTTPSIMDYARYNYIAQPGDKGVGLTPPDLGVYDYYAIEVGYRPLPEAKNAEEELRVVQSWIAAKSGDPMYRYGKQQVYDEYDPSALTEDLSDDAVKAGTYGIKNLQYILKNMNGWLDAEDRDYTYRIDMYRGIANQFAGYLKNALLNVGGYYLNESFVGDGRTAFSVLPKEKQKRAAIFVMEQLRTLDWIDAPEVTKNLTVGTPKSEILVKKFAKELVNTKRVSLGYYRDPKSYSPKEYLDDIYAHVWASTIKGRNLTKAERTLQYEVVCAILKRIQIPNHRLGDGKKRRQTQVETLAKEINPVLPVQGFGFQYYVTNLSNDNQAHLWYGLLIRVQKLMESRLNGGSRETRSHYGFLLEKIEDVRNWK